MTADQPIDRVFLVASGKYSDYRIHSLWTTREASEQHAGAWASVEEWFLNTTTERTILEWHAWIHTSTQEITVSKQASETGSPGSTFV